MALTTEREKIAHLLRRFGLGASEAEIEFYGRDGYRGAVDRLLASDGHDEGLTLELGDVTKDKNGRLNMPGAVNWWATRMLTTRRPLAEKMTLFWHDHFATSASKVKGGAIMANQNLVFREKGLGTFRDLLKSVSKDPAMIVWLDSAENRRGRANENFAREAMELFTLGIGHYTEADVKEAARAFTGWSLQRGKPADSMMMSAAPAAPAFRFRPLFHDDGPKTVLGRTASFDGDELLDYLCDQVRTSEYLTEKIWAWFAYPEPEPALVRRIASGWRQDGLQIKSLLKAVMLAPEFVSAKADRAVVKSPADFVVPAMRALGVGALVQNALGPGKDGRSPAAQVVSTTMKNMGMSLMYPPDVAGWDGGSAWITSAGMAERIVLSDRIFGTMKGKGPRMAYPALALLGSDPTPRGVVKRLLGVYDAPLKVERQKILVSAAERVMADGLTLRTAPTVAATLTKLIFASPEFQMM